eukprot:CAMPEP_0172899494 /NCGR_PEP_ID=MMETSP1075-20121228/161971_1 /TAXON_ID=2916 /ORGANISM="Ceratium fusus, Strain PA161109" /LENGTH=179 /DNA_ID=CAMNT_0013755497 /DNA_START=291 /DNA_END=830 /DNA_ORIENTATION=-
MPVAKGFVSDPGLLDEVEVPNFDAIGVPNQGGVVVPPRLELPELRLPPNAALLAGSVVARNGLRPDGPDVGTACCGNRATLASHCAQVSGAEAASPPLFCSSTPGRGAEAVPPGSPSASRSEASSLCPLGAGTGASIAKFSALASTGGGLLQGQSIKSRQLADSRMPRLRSLGSSCSTA